MKRCFEFLNGDRLTCTSKAAFFTFSAPRAVLSSGALGGGLRYDLTGAFNYCDCGRAGVCNPMEGRNIREHQHAAALQLGLDPEHTTGLDTAANLDNMVVVTRRWENLWVTAAVSAGADVNALCAGDPAPLQERAGEPCMVPAGTINIFLVTGARLSPGAMTELVMTATEAKTAVLRDLMQGSSVSCALATGTGTDGIVVISDTEGEELLNGGKHFKLGELAACVVREAVREALFRQTGLCPQQQHTVLERLRRFGITEESLCPDGVSSSAFHKILHKLDRDAFLVGAAALYVHLLDECRAGMLMEAESLDWADHLLGEIAVHYQCGISVRQELSLPEKLKAFLSDLISVHLRERERLYGGDAPCKNPDPGTGNS